MTASRLGSTASHLTPRAISGTFTACNVAGFSAVAPLASHRRSIGSSLQPLGWLAVDAGTVAGTYGAVGALAGTHIPQLSSDTVGRFPVHLIQSVVVFGVIGSVMIAIGLASAGVLGNPTSASLLAPSTSPGCDRGWPYRCVPGRAAISVVLQDVPVRGLDA